MQFQSYLQFLDEFFQVALGSFLSHNFEHLLTNGTDLTSLCIACRLSLLVALLLGEANAKQSQMVTVSGADVHEGFNKRLPLANQGAQFVTGHVHAMEVGDDIVSLYIFSHKLDLSVALSLITTVKVSKGYLKHTTLQALRSDFRTNSLGDNSSSGIASSKHRRGLDLVGLLSGEGVNAAQQTNKQESYTKFSEVEHEHFNHLRLLLVAFAALSEPLVLPDSHETISSSLSVCLSACLVLNTTNTNTNTNTNTTH